MVHRIEEEAKLSDWTVNVRRSDNTVFGTYRWVKQVLKGKEARYGEINWLALRLRQFRKGGILAPEEVERVGAMLGCSSITLEEGAKEMLVIAYPRQREEIRKMVLHVLTNGRKQAAKDAMDVVFEAGDASCICAVAEALVHFKKDERNIIVRRMGMLVRENADAVELAELKGRMGQVAAELCRKGELGAPEEMKRYFLDLRKAVREAGLEEKKKIAGKRGGNGGKGPLRKAASY